MDPQLRRPQMRLWVISLVLFAGGFASRVAAHAWVDNVAWSYPVEFGIQYYAYLAALVTWGAWLVLQASPSQRGLGCSLGVVLAAVSFFALLSSIPK